MEAFRTHRWLRIGATVLAYPALLALCTLALAAVDGGTTPFVATHLAVTVAYGAVVARWWAIAVPAAWSAVALGALRVSDLISGTCSVCGSDEDWRNAWAYMLVFVTAPLTAAMLVGVVASRLVRFFATLSGVDGAYPARPRSASPSKR